jgi:4-methyl-5(b-hydroxyethyl)-thiazole monophosphate biosynthesis
MSKVLVILADGFEEIEAVTIIDVLRRADIQVIAASLGEQIVRGAHDLSLTADCLLDDVSSEGFDAVILPGGMPGSRNLRDDPRVMAHLRRQVENDRYLGAICAAPIALEAAGVLKGKRATSYPGHDLPSARYCEDRVVTDGKLVTSRGPGTALEFALEWVRLLAGTQMADQLRTGMIVSRH